MHGDEFAHEASDLSCRACIEFITQRNESLSFLAVDSNNELTVFFLLLALFLIFQFGHGLSFIV
jgi:hypothetical protein